MKNKGLIICLIIVAILIAIILIFKEDTNKNYNEITYTEYQEKLNNKETFILYIHQTGCTACKNFAPKFKKVINENNITVYALNLSNLTKDEQTEFYNNISIIGTPTVIFYTDGLEEDENNRIVGVKTETIIKNKLKNMGYIK